MYRLKIGKYHRQAPRGTFILFTIMMPVIPPSQQAHPYTGSPENKKHTHACLHVRIMTAHACNQEPLPFLLIQPSYKLKRWLKALFFKY